MLYIQNNTNQYGGYNSPQTAYVNGLVNFPDKFIDDFRKYSGFVNLTIENNTVIELTPNNEAWEEWKAQRDTQTDEETETSDADIWDELDKAYSEGVNSAYEQ